MSRYSELRPQYSYTYDDNDAILTETDPLGNVTKYMNNLHGQAVKQTLPNGAEYSYEYDSLDRIVKFVSPLGLSIAYTYDVSGPSDTCKYPGCDNIGEGLRCS